MRRITTGIQGGPIIGTLTTLGNTLKSIEVNDDIELEPNGTGEVKSESNIQINDGNTLKLADNDSSNFVGLKSAGSVATSYTLTMPDSDGTTGQALTTDGSGALSWTTTAIPVTDQTSDAGTYYPLIVNVTSGNVTAANVSSSRLRLQPSTGNLTVPIVTGGTGASNTLTLRSTSNATKGQVFVDETTASTTTATGALRVGGGLGVGGQLTAATIVETSSIAFKENVTPIESALDKLSQLVGVVYDRKDGSSVNEAGFIAEEVAEVIPNVVTHTDDGNVYGLQYTKLTAYIVEAIKELKDEVNRLKGNG